MGTDLEATFAALRPALLRHCYRMVGSYAEAEDLVQSALERGWRERESYRGDAPVERWLYTIATNACLNALKERRVRLLPQLEFEQLENRYSLEEQEPHAFITPAPDARLFPDPAAATESKETVALAFIALLQKVPPRQRAALLMKDVLGWSAEEIADSLELTVSSVNSALHRGREAISRADIRTEPPSPTTVQAFVRAWETRDLEGLVALLRDDVTLAMPPYTMWFHGVEGVRSFLLSPRFQTFWSGGIQLVPAQANGSPAFAFYRAVDGASLSHHSIMVARFLGGRVAEMTVFMGPAYFSGFDLPPTRDRTVS